VAHILIIDDQDHVRRLIQDLLPPHHRVLEAKDGVEGLRVYCRQPVDLVLCDLFMPDKDGIETIRELRRHDPAVKIVAMSGGSFDGRMNLLGVARALGADGVLGKPFDHETLCTTVEEALAEAGHKEEISS
jgi:two-component system response regulator (stage 0 sporulation protein F)